MLDDRQAIDLGRIITDSFSILRSRLLTFIGLFACVAILPALVFFLAFALLIGFSQSFENGVSSGTTPFFFIGLSVLLIMIILTALFQAAVINVALSDKANEDVSIANTLRKTSKKIIPIIGLTIVTGIALLIGFSFLFLPAFFMATMWFICLPIVASEKQSVFAAIAQSRKATKGSRWKIFALIIVMTVLFWLFSMITGLIGQLVPSASALISIVVMMFFMTFPALIMAYCYMDLCPDSFAHREALHNIFA